jgi:hypothetical protein
MTRDGSQRHSKKKKSGYGGVHWLGFSNTTSMSYIFGRNIFPSFASFQAFDTM